MSERVLTHIERLTADLAIPQTPTWATVFPSWPTDWTGGLLVLLVLSLRNTNNQNYTVDVEVQLGGTTEQFFNEPVQRRDTTSIVLPWLLNVDEPGEEFNVRVRADATGLELVRTSTNYFAVPAVFQQFSGGSGVTTTTT